MQLYRCYFINNAKSITSVEIIECPDDAAARQAGLRLLLEYAPLAIEVWIGLDVCFAPTPPVLKMGCSMAA